MPKLTGATRIKDRLGDGGGSLYRTNSATSTKQEYYLITLTNDSSVPLKDLSVEYKIYIVELRDTGFNGAHKHTYGKKGVVKVQDLEIGETCKVSTETITLENKTGAYEARHDHGIQ